jgi:serine/threonine-protein kinase
MKTCPVCDKDYGDDVQTCPVDGATLLKLPEPGVPAADPLIGTVFAKRYLIDARIGVGGMGAVYKGEDRTLGRKVAIKVLQPELRKDAEQVKRFFNEAKVVAKLRHPNTIQVFEFGEADDGSYYIAMEFMTGEQLDDHVAKHEMSLLRIIEIIDQVCQSLEEAHAMGIIHRDLKPDNVFIDTVNNKRTVKVIDFGIAKLVSGGENLTQAGMVFGTPAYMSPEQAKGEVLDARSDLYSLGVIVFFLLTGRPVFTGENPMEIAIKHITTAPPSVQSMSRYGELPPPLVQLVDAMLSKDRDARPGSAADVRQALLNLRGVVLAGGPTSAPTAIMGATDGFRSGLTSAQPSGTLEVPTAHRGPGLAGAAMALLALGAVGTGAWLVLPGLLASATAVDAPPDAAGSGSAVAPEAATLPPAVATADPAPALSQSAQAVRLAVSEANSAAVAARVAVLITSTPGGAEVVRTDTGASLGTTPFSLVLASAGDPVPLSLSAAGRQTVEVIAGRDGTPVTVTLPAAGRPQGGNRPARPNNETETPPANNEPPRREFNLRRPVTIAE